MPPNQPATPTRSLRVPDEIWDEVKRVAADRRETVTEFVIRAIRRELLRHPSGD